MADDTAPAPAAEEAAPPTAGKRRKLLTIVAAVAIAAGAIYGVWYFLTQAGRVSTDNAYVGADSATVTALVSGPVLEVRVSGTQAVNRGDILAVIDDADARIDLASAEAALRQAEQRYGANTAQASSARSQVSSRAADIAQARARLAQADAVLERARIDMSRREGLVSTGAASAEELSTARAAFRTAQADRALAQAGVTASQATEASAGQNAVAQEALVRGTTLTTSPDIKAAQARVDKARLDLQRTVIRAPVSGIVTNRQVQLGQRVAAGAPIMTIVPTAAVYVDANFKESQLRHVKVGQPVELTSDYYGGDVVYHGKVIGFAGGTGAAFSLIPAQNATGNWVKVVQRLPVRVILDANEVKAHPLRVGLSMDAIIDTRGK